MHDEATGLLDTISTVSVATYQKRRSNQFKRQIGFKQAIQGQ